MRFDSKPRYTSNKVKGHATEDITGFPILWLKFDGLVQKVLPLVVHLTIEPRLLLRLAVIPFIRK
jgi:hypothetical protein